MKERWREGTNVKKMEITKRQRKKEVKKQRERKMEMKNK
jgi:hypothetical protein